MKQEDMEEFEDIHIEEDQKNDADKTAEKKDKKKNKKDKNNEEVEVLQMKFDELNDKYLRLFSEFDNFRKRTIKEKIEMSKTASEEVITSLLPILDDLERAIANIPSEEQLKSQLEGIQLISNKLNKTLEQKGLTEMQTKNADFDTDFHEALTHIPAPEPALVGKVIDEIQKGYTLNGKVIRYAKVVVGS
ncbi:MAG: nucleotide exchange factor GrpE [Bacteroidales bacterium]|nr:nucleotide exchange factor GrpE [Bacteroidales bacterium]